MDGKQIRNRSLDYKSKILKEAVKIAVQWATTTALPSNTYNSVSKTLTANANGILVIDGSPAGGMGVVRVLIQNEAIGLNNGWYLVTNPGSISSQWILTRDIDSLDVVSGVITQCVNGTQNAQVQFILTNPDPIVIDSTALIFISNNTGRSITVSDDGTLGGGTPSHTSVTTQNAVRTYINNNVANNWVYEAWADDVNGNGFVTTFDPNKAFTAILNSSTKQNTLTAPLFAGLWFAHRAVPSNAIYFQQQTPLVSPPSNNQGDICFVQAAPVNGVVQTIYIYQRGSNAWQQQQAILQVATNALSSLTDVNITNVQNGQILIYNSSTGKWENHVSSTNNIGLFGIASSSGSYTFYTTLQAAINTAVSGQTIEFFTDYTETTNSTVNLKNGVNIHTKGHTYTLSNSGNASCLSDNGIAIKCNIWGNFIRIGGNSSNFTDTNSLNVSNSLSVISCNGTFISDQGGKAVIYNNGTIQNPVCYGISSITSNTSWATIYNDVNGIIVGGSSLVPGLNFTLINFGGIVINFNSFGAGITNNNGGKLYSCYGNGGSVQGINNISGNTYNSIGVSNTYFGITVLAGNVYNSIGISSGNYGFYNTGGNCFNCSGYSSANVGFYAVGSSAYSFNCSGYSTASNAITTASGAITIKCYAYSTANQGIVSTSSNIYDCIAISTSAEAINMDTIAYRCIAKSTWANAAGHAIKINGNNTEIFSCNLEVFSTSANCINSGSAFNCKYGLNTFKGATTPVNANITQSETNSVDSKGNITI